MARKTVVPARSSATCWFGALGEGPRGDTQVGEPTHRQPPTATSRTGDENLHARISEERTPSLSSRLTRTRR